MKKFNIKKITIDQVLKLTLTALILAVTATTSTLAYGPSRRATYTIDQPASKVTFNSITNNPKYGDERNFTLVKPASNTAAGGWYADSINVDQTEEFLVRVYVHNNAAANLNLTAKNTRLFVDIPTTTAKQVSVNATISADNADPKQVWDNVIFKSSKDFNIAYIAGSARYKNNFNPNPGFAVTDDLFTKKGARIGYDKMDGNLLGCYQYSGILTFRVKVQMSTVTGFKVFKNVRKHGTEDWKKSIVTEAGQKVDYLLEYRNIGKVTHKDIVLKDLLPTQFRIVDNSLVIKNAAYPNIKSLSQSNLKDLVNTKKGLNVGNYNGNQNVFLRFTVITPAEKDLKKCGVNSFRNTVSGGSDVIGRYLAYADVSINKKCNTAPTTDSENSNTVKEIPKTGPAEIILSTIGLIMVTMAVVYWYRSEMMLKKITIDSEDK